jgi:Fe-S-cluster containining protein
MVHEEGKTIQEQRDSGFVDKAYSAFRDEAEAAHRFLEELYRSVPRTVCDNCGKCCRLTEAESAAGYFTMFPLYAIEYINIVCFVRTRFHRRLQRELLGCVDEHPLGCPFRDEQKRACIIYPVRPLICRTYGTLHEEDIQRAVKRHAGDLPDSWLHAFAAMERSTFCPNVRVVERDRMDEYLDRKARFGYVVELEKRSRDVHLLDRERQSVFLELTGVEQITRWTWGGYNRVVFSPLEWMRKELLDHWRSFELVRKGSDRKP